MNGSSRRCRLLIVALAAALIAVACSGSEEVTEPPGASAVESFVAAVPLSQVAPSLEFLGELAEVEAGPTQVTFDQDGGTFTFDDGATLQVPAGAFAELTEVTALLVDLDYGRYLDNPPRGRAYVLATVENVALAEPLTLQIPVSSDNVSVAQLTDDQWQPLEVGAGNEADADSTVSVAIRHFSEVPTVLLESGDGEPTANVEADDGLRDAVFFRTCMDMHMGWFQDPEGARGLGVQLAYSVCVRALINARTPFGESVSTACVADRIGGEIDLQAAIDACLDDNDDAAAAAAIQEPTPTVVQEPTLTVVQEPAPTVDVGPLEWVVDGEFLVDSDQYTYGTREGVLNLTRTPGTDEFSVSVFTSYTATGNTGLMCTVTYNRWFEGAGRFWFGDLQFEGEEIWERVSADCPDLFNLGPEDPLGTEAEPDPVNVITIRPTVDAARLRFNEFEFDVQPVPAEAS